MSLDVFSQDALSFKHADSLTYDLYLKKNWSELIINGKEAIKNGHDYFYMRMRIGIAFYERKNYGQAAFHFRKALVFNETDQLALEYLFYCYYFTGSYFQAWSVLPGLNPENREKAIKGSRIKRNSLTLETFYSNVASEDIISDPEKYFTSNEGGSQTVTKSLINNAIYMSHIIGKRFSYYHAFTNLIKDNYFHYYDGNSENDLPSQRVIQNQYYGRLTYFTSSGWSFSSSFHYLTAAYPLSAIDYTVMPYTLYSYQAKSNGFAGCLGFSKTSGFITLSAEAVYSEHNNNGQVQGTFSIVAYPAGNRNIYLGGSIATISSPWQSGSSGHTVTGFIAGVSVKSQVMIEFSGATGNMKNFTEEKALVIYNGIDVPDSKFIARVIVPFYKSGITLFTGAGMGSYSSEYLPFDGFNTFDPNRLEYKNYSFTGGLSWNF